MFQPFIRYILTITDLSLLIFRGHFFMITFLLTGLQSRNVPCDTRIAITRRFMSRTMTIVVTQSLTFNSRILKLAKKQEEDVVPRSHLTSKICALPGKTLQGTNYLTLTANFLYVKTIFERKTFRFYLLRVLRTWDSCSVWNSRSINKAKIC